MVQGEGRHNYPCINEAWGKYPSGCQMGAALALRLATQGVGAFSQSVKGAGADQALDWLVGKASPLSVATSAATIWVLHVGMRVHISLLYQMDMVSTRTAQRVRWGMRLHPGICRIERQHQASPLLVFLLSGGLGGIIAAHWEQTLPF